MRDQKKNHVKFILSQVGIFIILLFCIHNISVFASPTNMPVPFPKVGVDIGVAETGEEVVSSLQILFILTIIALAPSILMMMTSFTRIIVVLHFLRSALGTQQTPPNQVLIGLALFLTFFIMGPVFNETNVEALQPYAEGEITQEEAIQRGMKPFREFMFRQVEEKDLALFMQISKTEKVSTRDEIPSSVLIPAFIISELKTAFQIGFLIYIPFIVIDMVVASTLMSMGMMMLPPVMISLPFKVLLFIMVDGWNLVIGELVKTFR
ncbi:MAG: flagellar type III secretion system pore protein FliP [Epulopiscium sp.]|nr:flagellar type III secretion system pore protein FliP [Candidatus Epulonipiscium sp.]